MSTTALRTIEAHGVTGLERPGDGARTLVFLHGIGSNAQSFAPLLMQWPAGPRLIAWNAPGYGNSVDLKCEWPLAADYAASLAELLDARAIKAIDLVGHSLGCLMAGAFTRLQPGRVRTLALVSPALGYGVPPGATLPAAIAARITDLETHGPQNFAQLRGARLVHQPNEKPAIVAAVRRAMAQVSMPGYGQAVRMLASGDLIADLHHVAVPVLIVCGSEDLITPPAGAERLHNACLARPGGALQTSPLALIPDAGHAVYLEAPARITELLNAHAGVTS